MKAMSPLIINLTQSQLTQPHRNMTTMAGGTACHLLQSRQSTITCQCQTWSIAVSLSHR